MRQLSELMGISSADPILVGSAEDTAWFRREKKKVHLFAFGLMYCTTIDFLCIFISSALNRDDDYSDKLLYLMIGVLIFITAFIVSKKSTVNSSKLYPVESISPMLYIVMIISELSIYYDITFAESLPLYKAVSFGLKIISGTVLILGFLYFAVRITKLLYKQRESDAIIQAELRHYEEIMQKNEFLREFRHDYQNNLFALSCLINSGKYRKRRSISIGCLKSC